MIREYKFREIQDYLKKDSTVSDEVFEALNHLTDAAIIFCPIIFGPNLLPLLGLLDVKDRLIKLGQTVCDAIISRKESDYLDRIEQLKAAYGLIYYTAYFDVFSKAFPKKTLKKLETSLNKKKVAHEVASATSQLHTISQDVCGHVYYADHAVSFIEIKKQLGEVYGKISHRIIRVIEESNTFDKEKDSDELESIRVILKELPKKAISAYEAQYLKLATQFGDFAFFSQLKNIEGIQRTIEQNGQNLSKLIEQMSAKVDVGLSGLNSLVSSVVVQSDNNRAQSLIDDLKRKYRAIIDEPIIDAKEISQDTEQIKLQFPKINEAFIPQSYKSLQYRETGILLESDTVWEDLPQRNDLNSFLIRYLESPDSIEYPLVILGQPGSGKSLLTKVLSAQLMSKSYTTIRIPLREVNAQDGIDVLVEDRIQKTINRSLLSVGGYGWFAKQFTQRPLTIILDGYDELLQAKGDVFSGYLESVRRFQQDQKSLARPVRVIITSRVTLINKVRIPLNSTILRLMEFTKEQQAEWIKIWNKTNAEYFSINQIAPFNLPENVPGSNKIHELAEQPLLLLMLALYDSEANELANAGNIKRTDLYDNLIRRFVRRERSRYVPGFGDKTSKEQETIVDAEMNRLGVAAIGMYNRRDVVILASELENDLDAFSAHRSDGGPKPRTLKESVSVIGSFFFINQSIAKDADADSNNSESAYEFLHATFGEFLAADFILRNIIEEVTSIYVDRKYRLSSLESKLSNADNFSRNWYYCLMFVPLYSRIVIIEMMQEHSAKAIDHFLRLRPELEGFSKIDFCDNLQFIIQNQLQMILKTRLVPKVMQNGIIFDRNMPLIGYYAVYSLNLVILGSTLLPKGFLFKDNDAQENPNGNKSELALHPWDELASLWKAWFPAAELVGLSAILKAKRVDALTIQIKCNEKFEAIQYEQPIDMLLCVSSTLADNLLLSLSGLQTHKFSEITGMESFELCEIIRRTSPDLYFSYLSMLLKSKVNKVPIHRKEQESIKDYYNQINNLILEILTDDALWTINETSLIDVCESVEYCIQNNAVFMSTRISILKNMSGKSKNGDFEWDYIMSEKIHHSPRETAINRLLKRLIPYSETSMPLMDNIENGVIFLSQLRLDLNKYLRGLSRSLSSKEAYWPSQNALYYMPTINSLEKYIMMTDRDEARMLERFLTKDNIEIMVETRTEFASMLMLDLSRKNKIHAFIVDAFLGKSIYLIRLAGVYSFGFNATLNVLRVAERHTQGQYLKKLKELLQTFLFEKKELFPLVYNHPLFIAELISCFPDIFEKCSDIIDFYSFREEESFWMINSKNTLDYIHLIRCILNNKDLKERLRRITVGIFKSFLSDNNFITYIESITFENLTLRQIDDLHWYADHTENNALSTLVENLNARMKDPLY